jgi:hypothetical protein
MPDLHVAAIMSFECEHVSALDYSKGLGHADALHLTLSSSADTQGEAGAGI